MNPESYTDLAARLQATEQQLELCVRKALQRRFRFVMQAKRQRARLRALKQTLALQHTFWLAEIQTRRELEQKLTNLEEQDETETRQTEYTAQSPRPTAQRDALTGAGARGG